MQSELIPSMSNFFVSGGGFSPAFGIGLIPPEAYDTETASPRFPFHVLCKPRGDTGTYPEVTQLSSDDGMFSRLPTVVLLTEEEIASHPWANSPAPPFARLNFATNALTGNGDRRVTFEFLDEGTFEFFNVEFIQLGPTNITNVSVGINSINIILINEGDILQRLLMQTSPIQGFPYLLIDDEWEGVLPARVRMTEYVLNGMYVYEARIPALAEGNEFFNDEIPAVVHSFTE